MSIVAVNGLPRDRLTSTARVSLPALLFMLLGCSSPAGDAAGATLSEPELAALRDCSAPNTVHAASIPEFTSGLAHSWAYAPLSLAAFNDVLAATRALVVDDLSAAVTSAKRAGYELVPLATDSACQLLLQPTEAAPAGQARFVFSRDYARDLVIEAPHVPEDHGTDAEAALLFEGLRAKGLILAGAHRCAVTTASGCRSSNQCNKVGIPVESDPSHSIHNAVNAVHLAFRGTSTTVLQLHTNFRADVNGDARVSNGTRYAIPGTPADAFFQALQSPDIDARWCNDPAAPPEAAAFCGESNTQGLASNGAADQCLGHPSAAGGAEQHRFIHLEQNNARMDAVDVWSARIQAALALALPAKTPR